MAATQAEDRHAPLTEVALRHEGASSASHAAVERFTVQARFLAGTIISMIKDAGAEPLTSMEMVFDDDVVAVIQGLAGSVISVADLRDFQASRMGGTVVGKTFFRDDPHNQAVVVMDTGLLVDDDLTARLGEIFVLAHELVHVLRGRILTEGGATMPTAWLPWKIACWYSSCTPKS